MKDILFVRDLVIERVPAGHGDTLRYQYLTSPMHAMRRESPVEVETSSKVVPVVELTGGAYGDEQVLLAYSERVEQALGIPISVIFKEKQAAQAAHADAASALLQLRKDIKGARFWRRIKYAITGDFGI